MRQSAQLVLLMSLTFFTGAAYAVDRGQFENVPDDIRAWFKGVRSPDGVPCCDISDGHRTEYDVRAGAYWVPINGLWWRVPEKAIIRNGGNPVGEALDIAAKTDIKEILKSAVSAGSTAIGSAMQAAARIRSRVADPSM